MGQVLHGSAKTTEAVRVAIKNSQESLKTLAQTYAWMHLFARICPENQLEHRLAKISHPWTNGQVERMNRTLKEATVKRY